MANSSITYSNALAKINNKPLKCIITNNKNSIRYLSDSGSMIIYSDPSKQDYYEIYIGGKFISGGYGFPKDQYNQLSYLASTYNYTYTDIWNMPGWKTAGFISLTAHLQKYAIGRL